MSRLDELPLDQRAALALLLAQRKSYAEVSGMLGIADRAVHDRAHAALAVLAPAQARGLSAEDRESIGEHLLGQQTGIAERLRTRTLLDTSAQARDWAHAVRAELAPLAGDALPEVPTVEEPGAIAAASAPAGGASATAVATPAPPSAGRGGRPPAPGASARATGAGTGPPLPSSRVGGALVLAAIVAAVVVAVVLLTSGGSSHKHAHGSGASTAAAATTTTGPAVTAKIPLRSPSSASRSVGLLQILAEGSKRAFYVVAEHMPASNGFFYALWLYNSPTRQEPLGKAPPVGSSHRLEGGGALPADAGEFHEVLLTRETSPRPSHPGTIVLRGAFTAGA